MLTNIIYEKLKEHFPKENEPIGRQAIVIVGQFGLTLCWAYLDRFEAKEKCLRYAENDEFTVNSFNKDGVNIMWGIENVNVEYWKFKGVKIKNKSDYWDRLENQKNNPVKDKIDNILKASAVMTDLILSGTIK